MPPISSQIYVDAAPSFTIGNSVISSNLAESRGGLGGGLYIANIKIFSISNSSVLNNTAAGGGAIYTVNTQNVTISDSSITGNAATDSGGSIYSDLGSSLMIMRSNLSFNSAAGDGGAVSTYVFYVILIRTKSQPNRPHHIPLAPGSLL